MARFLDILISTMAIIFLLPIFIPIIILLKFTGEGEVFYFQDRVGKNGKLFSLSKFATMLKNSPNIGTGHITTTDDPRVLPIGRFLRKSKINELPQLYNILKGDMSFVGPRPLTYDHFEYYNTSVRDVILSVRPGLTGIGSIIFRDEEKFLSNTNDPVKFYSQHIAPYKGELELWYINNRNIKIYFLLILLTILAVLKLNYLNPHNILDNLPPLPNELKKNMN